MIYILILLIIFAVLLYVFKDDDFVSYNSSRKVKTLKALDYVVTGILTACVTCTGILCIVYASYLSVPEKIKILTEENQMIEERIEIIVEGYFEYESETYENIKGNATEVILFIPTLSSSTVVQKQLEIYHENHKTISRLKQERANLYIVRKLLFFV